MSKTPHKLVGIQQLLKATEEKFKEWLKRKQDNLQIVHLKVNLLFAKSKSLHTLARSK